MQSSNKQKQTLPERVSVPGVLLCASSAEAKTRLSRNMEAKTAAVSACSQPSKGDQQGMGLKVYRALVTGICDQDEVRLSRACSVRRLFGCLPLSTAPVPNAAMSAG